MLDNAQDKRIFKKLARLAKCELGPEQERLIKFLYSQLEQNWRAPLEKFVGKLLK